MKYQTMKKMLFGGLAGVMTVIAPVPLYAAEAETEISVYKETETEDAGKLVYGEPEDFVLDINGREITVKNEAVNMLSAELTEIGTDTEMEMETVSDEDHLAAEESGAEKKKENAESEQPTAWNLILTEMDGSVHVFEHVSADQWIEPELICELEWLYIQYRDERGDSREIAEMAEEKEYETPVAMWVTTDVNIRKEASADSDILCVGTLGSEWEALGILDGWIRVKGEDFEGYVHHRYLTADQEAAAAAVQAEKDARDAAQAAAAVAASQAVRAQPEKNSWKKVVSRQAYDDCDGSGHGYYEIVYSDGSVVYENY